MAASMPTLEVKIPERPVDELSEVFMTPDERIRRLIAGLPVPARWRGEPAAPPPPAPRPRSRSPDE